MSEWIVASYLFYCFCSLLVFVHQLIREDWASKKPIKVTFVRKGDQKKSRYSKVKSNRVKKDPNVDNLEVKSESERLTDRELIVNLLI